MITKTDFLMYLDAPRHLWAFKNNKLDQKVIDSYTQHLLEQGYEVETLAQEYRKKVLKKKYEKIYTQQKCIEGEFEARIDILCKDGEYYDIYEVKSSTSVKNNQEMDATFQYCIFKGKYNIRNVYILHLNPEYIKEDSIDVEEIFLETDITDVVKSREDLVLKLREDALRVSLLENPDDSLNCIKPKTCVCLELCHSNLPEYPIYSMRRAYAKKIRELQELNIYNITDIPDSFDISDLQKLQVKVAKDGKEYINDEMVKYELSKAVYPLYFLDYEGFNSAIPIYNGYKPYEYLIFQFSLHVKETPDSEHKHYEYIFTKKGDPAKSVLEELKKYILETGSIVVWNATFEGTVNETMARIHPEFNDFITSINSRMYDLMNIFKEMYYDNPKMKGSYSIKKVLPIFDSSLNYADMNIHEGATAMSTWNDIVNTKKYSKEEKEKLILDMLEYCKLDTLAMVKIFESLEKRIL